jgi:hypothetical protein
MPRKSRVVGPATDSDSMRTTAYRAVVPFVCVQCRGAILPDHMFSRRSQHVPVGATRGVTAAPVCATCRPLRVEGATDASAPTEGDHHER